MELELGYVRFAVPLEIKGDATVTYIAADLEAHSHKYQTVFKDNFVHITHTKGDKVSTYLVPLTNVAYMCPRGKGMRLEVRTVESEKKVRAVKKGKGKDFYTPKAS